MAGTDHGKAGDWAGPQPVIILVAPQMGENIGAAARAMWNFGLDRLRLVRPRDGWPNEKAVAMASGAGQVLDHVRIYDSTQEAIGDLTYVFATTARNRDLTKDVTSPQEAMEQTRARVQDGQRIGILFGPERAGLENEDIIQANALISVPVNPAFASLNLAQSVLLMAYEWRKTLGADIKQRIGKAQPATQVDMHHLSQNLEERLNTVGYFWPEDKAESMRQNLRNLLSRLPLNDADVRSFHGVFRALAGKPSKES